MPIELNRKLFSNNLHRNYMKFFHIELQGIDKLLWNIR